MYNKNNYGGVTMTEKPECLGPINKSTISAMNREEEIKKKMELQDDTLIKRMPIDLRKGGLK